MVGQWTLIAGITDETSPVLIMSSPCRFSLMDSFEQPAKSDNSRAGQSTVERRHRSTQYVLKT